MKKSIIALALLTASAATEARELVWSDEFNVDGPLNERYWNYENGFVRNHEEQWYQPQNAYCRDGMLVIEARRDSIVNPDYEQGSADWRKSRPVAAWSSASVNTAGKVEFTYGSMEVRARIPVGPGAWPAIWTLGRDMVWPSCGEIDVMEYYRIGGVPHILANAAWGTDRKYTAKWNSTKVPFSEFLENDPDWASKFHIWRMDWSEDAIKIYIDDNLITDIPVAETVNGSDGSYRNPMKQPHYALLNLALGGDNGGPIDPTAMPMRYEIDYIRLYK